MADHSPPPSAEVKNKRSFTPLHLYAFVAHVKETACALIFCFFAASINGVYPENGLHES